MCHPVELPAKSIGSLEPIKYSDSLRAFLSSCGSSIHINPLLVSREIIHSHLTGVRTKRLFDSQLSDTPIECTNLIGLVSITQYAPTNKPVHIGRSLVGIQNGGEDRLNFLVGEGAVGDEGLRGSYRCKN